MMDNDWMKRDRISQSHCLFGQNTPFLAPFGQIKTEMIGRKREYELLQEAVESRCNGLLAVSLQFSGGVKLGGARLRRCIFCPYQANQGSIGYRRRNDPRIIVDCSRY